MFVFLLILSCNGNRVLSAWAGGYYTHLCESYLLWQDQVKESEADTYDDHRLNN